MAGEFRTVDNLFDQMLADPRTGGVRAVAPGPAEAISITVPAGVSSVGIVGTRLNLVRRSGEEGYDTPGRPVALVSRVARGIPASLWSSTTTVTDMLDLIIVGAGPAGLAAAIAAGRRGLSYLVIEKGAPGRSLLQRFPTDMVFFTTPELLEIGGVPFVSPYEKPTRHESLRYYRRVTRRVSAEGGDARARHGRPAAR